ncbi:MAG: endonuclease III [Candidatus Gracilibacteria bacterium]|nr:endonuclease III [Candidatus Gracilibacteria bacterium]
MDINKVLCKLEEYLKDKHPPVIDLLASKGADPFKILVATLLSARTKDQVTTAVVRRLFAKIKNPKELAKLPVKQIEKLIYPVGFYRTKARHLRELAIMLCRGARFCAPTVPDTLNDLVKLPGVGRKTANLVLGLAFGKPAICVDTHVHRITNRLGYVRTKSPAETEQILKSKLPKRWWIRINFLLVSHGQMTCTPISPKCSTCPIAQECPKINVISQR